MIMQLNMGMSLKDIIFQTARWTPSSSKTVPPYIREWITREWGDSAEMRPAKSKKAPRRTKKVS